MSGYHMAVVAGIVFFFVRAGLALIPSLANRHPIKKWAALCALIGSALYLLLSGAEVATQRSFIMIAIVLIGVMLDLQRSPSAHLLSQPSLCCCSRRKRSCIRASRCHLLRHWH
jgi:predicted membrane metal-binding protein